MSPCRCLTDIPSGEIWVLTIWARYCNNEPMNDHLLVFIGAPWEAVLFMLVWALITIITPLYTIGKKS